MAEERRSNAGRVDGVGHKADPLVVIRSGVGISVRIAIQVNQDLARLLAGAWRW